MNTQLRHLIVLVSLLSIGGCATLDYPEPKRDLVYVSIELVDEIAEMPEAYGIARCYYNGVCNIKIRKDVYPRCITHEVMHAFSGPWHGNRKTTQFCDIK
jgi:hypothetical protein